MISNRIAGLVVSMLAFATAAANERPDLVVVTNGPGTPVPVVVTNPSGAARPVPQSIYTDVFPSTTAVVVPATGKRFVAKHISIFMTSNNSGTPLTDANCLLSLHRGSTSFSIATIPLQHADLLGAMGVSQNVYYVAEAGDSLEMVCLANPANFGGRATVSGDSQ